MSAADEIAALIDGYRGTALVYTAVRLGLPDRMGSAVWTAGDLAALLGTRPVPTHRLLRALSAIGVCEEDRDGRFALSEAGAALRTESRSGLAEQAVLAVQQYWPAWTALPRAVRDGGTGFAAAFGTGVWEHRRADPAAGATFDAWLGAQTARQAPALIEAIAAAIGTGDCGRVADIGGGDGTLLWAVVNALPQATGILFDQPHVVESARRANPELDCVAGDFLVSVPVAAQFYLLKSVLHDWDDDTCVRILTNCRTAMADSSRMLVIERTAPARAVEDPLTVLMDLHMLAVTGGRERTVDALGALLDSAGLAVRGVVAAGSGHTVIEAVPR